jgi:hypothetical protein
VNDKVSLIDNPIAIRFSALPAGVPGHFTRAELDRGRKIHQAEATRSYAELRALGLVERAFAQHPDAANAGEAIRLAGLEEEYRRRVDEIPEADEVGMRWLIDQTERSIAEGTFIAIPPQA